MTEEYPRTHGVLVILTDGDDVDAIVPASVRETVSSVEVCESVPAADDSLGPESGVGCVVVVDATDGDLVDVCRACRAADPDVPIVAVLTGREDDGADEVAGGDGEVDVGALTAVGDVRLATEQSPAVVAKYVDEAIETYERRVRLRDDATMFRSFLADSMVSLYVKDRAGRHVRMSNVPGGRDPQDVLGKRDTDVYPDSTGAKQSLEDDLRVVEEDTTIYGREENFETESGPQWLRTNKAPWRDERGRVRGVVGITLDVTDEMINQQRLAEREEAFETFARSLSHDVRTPLQVARGNLELLREAVDDTEPADSADAALERITEMMSDLEEVAKHELSEPANPDAESADPEQSDQQEPGTDIEPISIRTVAERVWNVIDSGDATLEIEFGDDAVVITDEASLRPLLENLFTNAIRHGGDGVSIRLGHIETGGFFVEDDGPGIPEDQRQKVTKEGFTTIDTGTGTGFSIVSAIVNRREWDLDITDSDEGGARVEIHGCMMVATPPADVEIDERVGLGQSDDVGDVGVPGSANYDGKNNCWMIKGGGTNIWHQANEFQFLHVAVEGAVRIQGRVAEFDHKSRYSKAGFMIRDDIAENATYGYAGAMADAGTEVLWRNSRGDDGVSQQLDGVPDGESWYRVDRVGDTVTTFVSGDGEEWTPLDQRHVELDDPIEVGLVVCSHVPQTLARATFANVTVGTLPDG